MNFSELKRLFPDVAFMLRRAEFDAERGTPWPAWCRSWRGFVANDYMLRWRSRHGLGDPRQVERAVLAACHVAWSRGAMEAYR